MSAHEAAEKRVGGLQDVNESQVQKLFRKEPELLGELVAARDSDRNTIIDTHYIRLGEERARLLLKMGKESMDPAGLKVNLFPVSLPTVTQLVVTSAPSPGR